MAWYEYYVVRFLNVYPDKPTITLHGTVSEDDVFFMSYPFALCQGRVRFLSQ